MDTQTNISWIIYGTKKCYRLAMIHVVVHHNLLNYLVLVEVLD